MPNYTDNYVYYEKVRQTNKVWLDSACAGEVLAPFWVHVAYYLFLGEYEPDDSLAITLYDYERVRARRD